MIEQRAITQTRTESEAVHAALQEMAGAVAEKMAQISTGEPEDQLRAPFENFMAEVARTVGWKVICTGETLLPGGIGKPDYAVHKDDVLAGYVELKAPGAGASSHRFRGRDHDQFQRFSAIPNILYTDGNEWALYRMGEPVGGTVCLQGNIAEQGSKATTVENARELLALLRDFLLWQPSPPLDARGRFDLRAFAGILAPLCRLLRDQVVDALAEESSPLRGLAEDWRRYLMPDATDREFADAYAQTATFALLLGRSEGADPLTPINAQAALAHEHGLLSQAVQVLTDPEQSKEVEAALALLQRVIGVAPAGAFAGSLDPWLYFYEDFLAVYDPKLRKDAGVYYTPVEVVGAQVRLVEELLVNRMDKSLGFADPDVVTLDPATGTGTYLLGVIDRALARVGSKQGKGALTSQADELVTRVYGFELMVGSYAVAELRVSRALRDQGAALSTGGSVGGITGARVYLADTLESPHATPPQQSAFLRAISEQRARAIEVKNDMPVLVCLGNPPYDRHAAATNHNRAQTGGWVRHGDEGESTKPILHDFLEPARKAGQGVRLKNLYNFYVYFWRWALWKVFEQNTRAGPGIVSFITASSYLDGDAFCGMREHMRRLCDEIWVLDLGGEGRGSRRSENVFAIQTPVAIAIAVRYGAARPDRSAKVHFVRIEGSRREKLAQLNAIDTIATADWQDCSDDWQAPFRPPHSGTYFHWPPLSDLMPWQHSGVQFKRTWPIAPNRQTLERRWEALLNASDKASVFRETADRSISGRYRVAGIGRADSTPISALPSNSPIPEVQPYAWRAFDRQWIIADARLISRPRPALWRAHGGQQLYFTSLLTKPLGRGPALMACAALPDLDHFSGRGAKDAMPLFRDHEATEPNLMPGLLARLSATFNQRVSPEDFAAYLYGAIAHPAYTQLYFEELESDVPHIPITKDGALFRKVAEIGATLLHYHTYGQRYARNGKRFGVLKESGKARNTVAVPIDREGYPRDFQHQVATQTLRVGAGEFAPVSSEVFEFEISGLKVVQSWLNYRLARGRRRSSSDLDRIRPQRWTAQFNTELLELLWVLEATLACYQEQARLFEAIIVGRCFLGDDLPPVPTATRKPPDATPLVVCEQVDAFAVSNLPLASTQE